jgi:hypothetical protein
MRRETIGELLNNSNNFNHPVKWVEPTLGFQKRKGGMVGEGEKRWSNGGRKGAGSFMAF